MGELASVLDRVVPPSLEAHVTVKLVIALPPVPFAVKPTSTELRPRSIVVSDGASGTIAAMKAPDATEAALSPNPLVATAVQVYVFALVSVPTMIGEVEPEADRVAPPSLEAHV